MTDRFNFMQLLALLRAATRDERQPSVQDLNIIASEEIFCLLSTVLLDKRLAVLWWDVTEFIGNVLAAIAGDLLTAITPLASAMANLIPPRLHGYLVARMPACKRG
jgi:hypothetical protein